MRKSWLISGLVLLLGLGALLAWREWNTIQAWYGVKRLTWARADDCEIWVDRLVALGPDSLSPLLGALDDGSEEDRARLQRVLEQIAENEPAAFSGQLASRFHSLGSSGQLSVLELWPKIIPNQASALHPHWMPAILKTLGDASRSPQAEVRLAGLRLAAGLLGRLKSPALNGQVRQIARDGLAAPSPAERSQAINLAVQPEIHLHEQVATMLHDPDAEVRRSALLAVEAAPEIIGTDELLRWLHDPDPEVRRLCEAGLRVRGLSAGQIQRGRWLTDPQPTVRLQVLKSLNNAEDVDPGVWLRHLSHDPEPAVRAAAARAAAEQTPEGLTDRLEQMARNDPSDTVRQVCLFYLSLER
jgi:hypothetical protein